jgi:hypothetical protein
MLPGDGNPVRAGGSFERRSTGRIGASGRCALHLSQRLTHWLVLEQP